MKGAGSGTAGAQEGAGSGKGGGLKDIPGVGEKISHALNLVDVHTVEDLRGREPEDLYRRLEEVTGSPVDRCVLYVFRAAVYYAGNEEHDPELLKWWNWKGRNDRTPGSLASERRGGEGGVSSSGKGSVGR